ncbi:MAG: chemotaxis protein CheD [Terriglobia bacterium]
MQPGEVYLALEPAIIRTILGSCVGVTFWSARLGAGALCHALLPRCPNNASSRVTLVDGRRYVDFVIRDLARQFDKLGALRSEVQVKLFGGADVLPISATEPLRPTVGRQNCEAAIEVLPAEGFNVIASSLGGTSGRNIQFHTGTGEVRLRWLSRVAFEEDTYG